MSAGDGVLHGIHFATLAETRRRLRSLPGLALVLLIAVPYTVASMLLGEMLLLTPVDSGYTVQAVYGSGSQWWNYPGLLIVQPWGVLTLPFFPTVAMLLVGAGVGLGGATGISLILPYLRRSRGGAVRGAPAGVAAGVGPAVTGLGTLGACCCTSCAGATGVAVVAAASGTSLNEVLFNNWYVGLFQIAVVYVALLAQERLLRQPPDYCPIPPPLDRRFAAGAVLRMALLVGGITWSLAMFVEWGDTSPATAPAATWYHWVFEHQLLAITAMAAGLFPREFTDLVRRWARRSLGLPWRAALVLAGVTWGVAVPPVLVAAGLGGMCNEMLGFLGVGPGLGGETPDAPLGAPLYFHWIFQHAVLAGFAIALGAAPTTATQPLTWTVGSPAPASGESRPTPPPGLTDGSGGPTGADRPAGSPTTSSSLE